MRSVTARLQIPPEHVAVLLNPDMGRPPSGGRTGVAIRSGSGGAEPGPLLKKA